MANSWVLSLGSNMTDFILASGSAGRRMILENAALAFDVHPTDVDEEAIRQDFLSAAGQADLASLALELACAKARVVSAGREDDMPVLGADQILVCEGELFSKPATMSEARENLLRLRGRKHRLISALAVARGGQVVWTHDAHADMHMRAFSDSFLDAYLEQVGERALASVGCYQVEGPGIQLFQRIDGDWFTIIGLPLLPFLDWLRAQAIIPA